MDGIEMFRQQHLWLWRRYKQSGSKLGFNNWIVMYTRRMRDMIRLLFEGLDHGIFPDEDLARQARQYIEE